MEELKDIGELKGIKHSFIDDLIWKAHKLSWMINPFKKETAIPLGKSHTEEVFQKFVSICPDRAFKIPKSKIEILPLQWYFDADNIPNQNMMHDTYNYFNKGQRKGFFEPHWAIGMSHVFWVWFSQSLENAASWIELTRCFDFTDEELHVLYGIVLYWYGGYPVRNMYEGQELSALRLLEQEFLNYEDNSPEKKICKRKSELNEGERSEWYERLDDKNTSWRKLAKSKRAATKAIITLQDLFSDDLINDLAEEGLIEKETLKWTGERALCAYFVDISFPKTISNKWVVAEEIFQAPNLRASTNYKVNKNGQTGIRDGKPRNHIIIDRIVERERNSAVH